MPESKWPLVMALGMWLCERRIPAYFPECGICTAQRAHGNLEQDVKRTWSPRVGDLFYLDVAWSIIPSRFHSLHAFLFGDNSASQRQDSKCGGGDRGEKQDQEIAADQVK